MRTKHSRTGNGNGDSDGEPLAVIVIGASAGGIEALLKIIGGLTSDFAGVILVVLHTSRFSALPTILARNSSLKVAHARDGEALQPGQVLVAPPDRHLVISDHHAVLSRGPKQNNARPAIDPLFRSAAFAFGRRVIGVILSGNLDDGSAGLVAVKRSGGICIVQSPEDAAYPEMPFNALAAVKPNHVLTAEAIGEKLNKLVAGMRVVSMKKSKSKPQRMRATEEGEPDPEIVPNGKVSTLTCPECGGTLWERRDGHVLRYVCHTGHEFSADSLQEAQGDGVEHALWVALRALKERAMFISRLGVEAQQHGRRHSHTYYQKEEQELKARAEVIQRVLLGPPGAGRSESNRSSRRGSTRKRSRAGR